MYQLSFPPHEQTYLELYIPDWLSLEEQQQLASQDGLSLQHSLANHKCWMANL